ncbi:Lipopolysaccharide-assembly [Pustulibacterium marinum]|uniref:Lipopolysaccharide-assembly n=1 Tax=Pustulibacterium marinum TaxID=1224947 RepID=A0A1I7GS72_9FLAO|nr:LptE family protein [Pustulibacterium marinum]SFU51298.1 Lipopolysaccharide-assembly [Pustulibacterium marinum]
MSSILKKTIVITCIILTTVSCKYYGFTGITTTAKSFQVNFFPNNAPIVDPGLDNRFRNALQDYIVNTTNLELFTKNAELIYEGEITQYSISPMSATASQTAAQNRLTIGVKVRFTDTRDSEKDFERTFSFYYDYPAATQLNSIKETAYDEILERITQDITNASLSNW